jgi:hypothetical protein
MIIDELKAKNIELEIQLKVCKDKIAKELE